MKVTVYPKDNANTTYGLIEHHNVERVEYTNAGTHITGLNGPECPTKRVLHINMDNAIAVLLEAE